MRHLECGVEAGRGRGGVHHLYRGVGGGGRAALGQQGAEQGRRAPALGHGVHAPALLRDGAVHCVLGRKIN